MGDIDYLECDLSSLEQEERDQILDEVVEELGSGVAVIPGDEVTNVSGKEINFEERIDSAPGPQAGGGLPTELILIALESSLVAIEVKKLVKERDAEESGMGNLLREKFRAITERKGQNVKSGTTKSLNEITGESDTNYNNTQ